MSHLVLDGLSKRYGDAYAVRDMSLSIAQGEFVSLLGPSGCGKTTTLQMIAGFVEPTSGSIDMDGRDLLVMPAAKRGLGIVFQNYALFPHLSVAGNVAFGLEMRNVGKADRGGRVSRVLDLPEALYDLSITYTKTQRLTPKHNDLREAASKGAPRFRAGGACFEALRAAMHLSMRLSNLPFTPS